MQRNKIPLALADVTQDIAGSIPLDLIQQWSNSAPTKKVHENLLEPYKRIGTAVASDSAGLSKLTARKTLLEVMKLVSEPKEIIYAYGRQAGGRAIGVWAADNTEMFYPAKVTVEEIIHHMASAQREIESLSVQVGMALHHGEFIDLGGGLFGEDADAVELLAENYTEGKEIAITKNTKELLPALYHRNLATKDKNITPIASYTFNYQNIEPRKIKKREINYPTPFPQEFFTFLCKHTPDQLNNKHKEISHFFFNKIVILIKVQHQKNEFLLDEFTDLTVANALMHRIARMHHIDTVKANGSLGIYVADKIDGVLAFVHKLKSDLKVMGFESSIGISRGEILLFPMPNSGQEIAGGPVNLASKLAEDSGLSGIIVHDSVPFPKQTDITAENFEVEISHVKIKGKVFL